MFSSERHAQGEGGGILQLTIQYLKHEPSTLEVTIADNIIWTSCKKSGLHGGVPLFNVVQQVLAHGTE